MFFYPLNFLKYWPLFFLGFGTHFVTLYACLSLLSICLSLFVYATLSLYLFVVCLSLYWSILSLCLSLSFGQFSWGSGMHNLSHTTPPKTIPCFKSNLENFLKMKMVIFENFVWTHFASVKWLDFITKFKAEDATSEQLNHVSLVMLTGMFKYT